MQGSEIVKRYLNCLEKRYGEEMGNVIFCLCVGEIAYSILARAGFRLEKPLAFIVDTARDFEMVVTDLKVFSDKKMLLNLNLLTEIQKGLGQVHDDALSILFDKGTRNRENLNFVLSTVKAGYYRGEPLELLTIVGFEKVIPDDLKEAFLTIHLPKLSYLASDEIEVVREFKRFLPNNIISNYNEIKRRFQSLSIEIDAKDLIWERWNFFKAAEVLCELVIEDSIDQSEQAVVVSKLRSSLAKVVKYDEETQDDGYISEVIGDILYQSAEQIGYFINRNNVTGEESALLGVRAMYDSEYYYFPDVLFREVCESLLESLSFRQVKHSLIAAGVLESNGGDRLYDTVKVVVYSAYGVRSRPRYNKLKREFIDRDGALTLVQVVNQVNRG